MGKTGFCKGLPDFVFAWVLGSRGIQADLKQL
jgi:hypothetical protein